MARDAADVAETAQTGPEMAGDEPGDGVETVGEGEEAGDVSRETGGAGTADVPADAQTDQPEAETAVASEVPAGGLALQVGRCDERRWGMHSKHCTKAAAPGHRHRGYCTRAPRPALLLMHGDGPDAETRGAADFHSHFGRVPGGQREPVCDRAAGRQIWQRNALALNRDVALTVDHRLQCVAAQRVARDRRARSPGDLQFVARERGGQRFHGARFLAQHLVGGLAMAVHIDHAVHAQ